MRAFLLDPSSPDHATGAPIPCHRAEGLGASLTLHLSVFVALAGTPAPAAAGLTPGPSLAFVSQVPSTITESTAETPTPPSTTESPADDGPAPGGPIAEFALALPRFDFDLTKIRDAETLFPFLVDPMVFLDEAREKVRPSPDRLVNPFGRERRDSTRPPLRANAAELQALVDRAWSRRERWSNFSEIAALLEAHDPHEGSASLLVRRYLDENLLQPYYDSTSRDPRFWVMLGLAADHRDLVEFIGAFVRQHPSSRTTTELLFMLDEFTQASRDTLLMLLSTDPSSQLTDTRDASLPAYQLAQSIHRRYQDLANRMGLADTRSLRGYFDDVRLKILRTIIDTTPDGYGASDARFLAGRILWDQNKLTAAYDWWSDLRADGRGEYAAAATQIRRELAFGDGQSSAEINRVLGQEYRRWLAFSEQRLREFGYEFDTF